MGNILSTADLVIFFGSLLAIMVLGLWVGRKEETSDDFFLAGRSSRWWGVAGSIFGSNVSANHIVGFVAVGFSVGFAQSHFEISAIAGLLVLCYAFLPMYRKLNLYTLSDYLGRRYDESCRLAYVVIMLIVIVVIQMVPGFYIGSRSLNQLLSDNSNAAVEAVVDEAGTVTEVKVLRGGKGYEVAPQVQLAIEAAADKIDDASKKRKTFSATATVTDGQVTSITIVNGGGGFKQNEPPSLDLVGGITVDSERRPGDVDPTAYIWGIVLMAVISGTYTILGGLKAVIVTDVVQSVLLLVAGVIVACVTFGAPEIGGWQGMVALDAQEAVAVQRLHLFLPSNHKALPWTGVLSGLFVLHFYYWGTNQFIVQRALAARSDQEARFGIIAAGFLKLVIPFISVGTGMAAFYLFRANNQNVDQDAVFTQLLVDRISPLGFGLVGIVAAGMVGAILSSLDSMMNSAATIVTFDIYKRYVAPDASQKQLVLVGRICIVVFIAGSALLTIFTANPNSKDSFFLQIASHQSRIVSGVVVAFFLGMLWSRATAAGAIAAIIAGAVTSYSIPMLYTQVQGQLPILVEWFGTELNFMHAVLVAALVALVVHVVISLMTSNTAAQRENTWSEMKLIEAATIRRFGTTLGLSIVIYAVLGWNVYSRLVAPLSAASLAFVWTWGAFIAATLRQLKRDNQPFARLFIKDGFWAGLLAATAVWMMYAFY